MSDDIALSILNVLKEKKISKKEFASRLGKQPSIISKWFNGQHNFTVKTIVDIENALNQKIVYPSIKVNSIAVNRNIQVLKIESLKSSNGFYYSNTVKKAISDKYETTILKFNT